MEKEIVFVLLDEFADWEAAFLAPALCSGVMPGRPGSYAAKYMSPDGESVRSIGGLRVTPDYDASTLPESCAGLILVGGMQWESAAARRIAPLAGEALKRGILVGAICNAVSFMAANGLLNSVRHTGNTVEMLKQWGGANYTGEALYEERQAVRDGNVVTANGTGYLEFTRECLLALKADTPDRIEASYKFNKYGFCSNGRARTIYPRPHLARRGVAARTGPRDQPAGHTAPHAVGPYSGPPAGNARADATPAAGARNRDFHGLLGPLHGRRAGRGGRTAYRRG